LPPRILPVGHKIEQKREAEESREVRRGKQIGTLGPDGKLVSGGEQKSMAAKSSWEQRDLKLGAESIRSSGSAPIVGGGGMKDDKVWQAGDNWAMLTIEVLWRPVMKSPASRRTVHAPLVCIGEG
jgi:hypothetical protein